MVKISNDKNDGAIRCDDVHVEYRLADYRHYGFKDFVLRRLEGKHSVQRFQALQGVSFSVGRGDSLALIGHNGSGKSTLLKVVAGLITPQQGTVLAAGRIAPLIELGAGFDFQLSGRENIELSCMLMGLSRREVSDRMEGIVHFADLGAFLDSPLRNYSSGMMARLGFACATGIEPDILLVDEVLAVGDSNFARKCLNRIETLRARGTTVVLVTHDMKAVAQFCDRALVMSSGRVEFAGSVSEAIGQYQEVMFRRVQGLIAQRSQGNSLAGGSVEATGKEAPKVEVQPVILQDGGVCQRELDVGRPFIFEFLVRIERPDLVADGLSFNVDFLYCGQVITGTSERVSTTGNSTVKTGSAQLMKIRFVFSKGIPQLLERSFEIALGIHDGNMVRLLFHGEIAYLKLSNSTRGSNLQGYVFELSDSDVSFESELV